MHVVAEDDAVLLEEELCAINAIFGGDCQVDPVQRTATVQIHSSGAPSCQLGLLYPSEGYPSRCPPAVELSAPHLPADMLISLQQEVEDIFLPGAVCTFDMVDLLKERLRADEPEDTAGHGLDSNNDGLAEDHAAAALNDNGVATGIQSPLVDQLATRIVTGEPFTDRKSTFQVSSAAGMHQSALGSRCHGHKIDTALLCRLTCWC